MNQQTLLSVFKHIDTNSLLNKSTLVDLIIQSGMCNFDYDIFYYQKYKNYNQTLGLKLNTTPEQFADCLIGLSKLNIKTYIEFNESAGHAIFTYLYLSKFTNIEDFTLVTDIKYDLSWVGPTIKHTNNTLTTKTVDVCYIDKKHDSTFNMLVDNYITNSKYIILHNIVDVSYKHINDKWKNLKNTFSFEIYAQQYKNNPNPRHGYGILNLKNKTEATTNTLIEEPPPELNINTNVDLTSIIIPCYNTSTYLKKTLNSIINQTHKKIEIIIVDDGSTEIESKKIENILKDFPIAAYHKLDVNMGAPHARNIGYDYSKGEWLLFCDSDVTLHQTYLQKMIKTLRDNPHCSWAYCNFHVGSSTRKFYDFDKNKLCRQNCCSTMSLIKTIDFPRFNESLKRLQDWELFYRMSLDNKIGKWVNEFLFFAEDRPGITKGNISWNDAMSALKKIHVGIK